MEEIDYYPLQNINDCSIENLYFNFMMISKNHRFYNRKTGLNASDRATVYWQNNTREKIYSLLNNTDPKWGIRLK